MERVKLYCGGAVAGEITLVPDGLRTLVRAQMDDPGDGLYRAALLGERGELLLGVMEPKGGKLLVSRRLLTRDLAVVGSVQAGEATCSIPFGEEKRWRESLCPEKLLRSHFWRSRLRGVERCWWRREGKRLYMALPVEKGRPFPLETIFCLAEIRPVGDRVCAVYSFDESERPLPVSIRKKFT